MVAFGACSTEELLQETSPGITSGAERTLLLTTSMPEEPTTRVDLEQNADKSINLTWETGDELQLVFVQGVNKLKQTVRVKNISEGGKKAGFDVVLPNASTGFDDNEIFDLYGVYGGGGIDISDGNLNAILPSNLADATSLAGDEATSIKNRKDVMLYFECFDVDLKVDNPHIAVTFKHLGSLFCVSLKNEGDTNLEDFLGVQLTGINSGDKKWAYNTGEGVHSYNLETEEFQNKEAAGNFIFFKAVQNSLPAGETITIWGWYPPLTGKAWPELKLELITSQPPIMSGNTLPARPYPTPAGKCYYFYAAWNGTSINFTNDSFTNEYTVHVETKGTLYSLLSATQKANTTKLTVTGQINKADYTVMKSNMPKLTYLDLSQATSYDGATENRIPPNALGDVYFANTKIATLILPELITSIGDRAFYNCTGLSGVLNIPDGVTAIEENAFYGCKNLTGSLILPTNLKTIGVQAFMYCAGFTQDLIIPDEVISIGMGAFSMCTGLKGTLKLPTSLTTIESFLFNSCPFTGTLTIPAGVTSIGEYAFSGCAGFSGTLTLPTNLTTMGKNAFSNCNGFTGRLKIPVGITKIEEGVFKGCKFNKELTIPTGVTSIGNNAFEGCDNFTGTLTIPDNVTSIGMNAFQSCSKIVNVVFPTKLVSIGLYGFYGCTNVVDFQFKNPVPISYSQEMLPNGKIVKAPLGTTDAYITKWGSYYTRHTFVEY